MEAFAEVEENYCGFISAEVSVRSLDGLTFQAQITVAKDINHYMGRVVGFWCIGGF